MWYFFRRGGICSRHRIDTGGQTPYISTNSQRYHYSFCPRGGQNYIANFDGGHGRICPPGSATACNDWGRKRFDRIKRRQRKWIGHTLRVDWVLRTENGWNEKRGRPIQMMLDWMMADGDG